MKTSTITLILITVTYFLTLPVTAQERTRRNPTTESDVEVKVWAAQVGYVPEDAWKVSQATVRLLFSRIGVRVRFITEPSEADPDVIGLLVWARAPHGLLQSVMGSAWQGGQRGRHANVFYDRVLVFSEDPRPHETGILLGYAIAHELAHVLCTEPGHSPIGVMKARWSHKDVVLMLQGVVKFTRAERKQIYEGMEERRLVLADQAAASLSSTGLRGR
jgi:hypothetical protein